MIFVGVVILLLVMMVLGVRAGRPLSDSQREAHSSPALRYADDAMNLDLMNPYRDQ